MFSKIMTARTALIALVLGSSVLTGCASIVNGKYQTISVETTNDNAPVAGVGCELMNNKGRYFVTTPATVTVHKGYQDLKVRCEKENLSPGTASVRSHVEGMAFGNILFGGLIGVAIDTGSGAAYDYPESITVQMGQNLFIPPRDASAAEMASLATPIAKASPAASATSSAAIVQASSAPPGEPKAKKSKAAKKSARQAEPLPATAAVAGRPAGAVVLPTEVRTGTSSASVEKLAAAIGCKTPVGAALLSEPGPVEDYEVKCDLGGSVRAKCELRQCRLE